MATKIKEATPAEVRVAGESLLASVRAFQAAEEAAIERAIELFALVDDAGFPRLHGAVHQEAQGILGDLDGSSGSVLEIERVIRDVEDLLELIDLAAKGEMRGG